MGMNELAEEIHANAISKGFWDSPRETGTVLMLCVTELSEALEADRKERYADRQLVGLEFIHPSPNSYVFLDKVKDTFEDEIADTIIRLLDLCGRKQIDIEWHIREKMKYNKSRPRLHGKKY